MNRVLLAVILTVLVSGVVALPVSARANVGNLVASTSESRDDATAQFPAGTTDIFAVFEYEDMANHNIGVSLKGFGLTDITSQVDRYDGTGEAAVLLTGSGMYRSLTAAMVAQAEAASSNAKKAADQETGRIDYLDGVRAALNSMGSSLALLEATDAGAEQSSLVADVSELVDELDELVGFAREQDLDDEEQKSRASALKQPAADLEAATKALDAGAQGVENVPFPSTGTQSSYTLQVTRSGSPSQSIEVFVLGEDDAPAGDALGGPSDGAAPTATQSASDGVGSGGTTGQTRNNPAGSDSGSTDGDSAAGSGSEEKESGSATTPIASGSSAKTPATSATTSARATAAVNSLAALGADTGNDADEAAEAPQPEGEQVAPDVDLAAAPMGDEQPAGQAGAAPTWTVPAVAQAPGDLPASADTGSSSETGGGGGSSGPNLAVLGLGAIALVGVALWLRQRA